MWSLRLPIAISSFASLFTSSGVIMLGRINLWMNGERGMAGGASGWMNEIAYKLQHTNSYLIPLPFHANNHTLIPPTTADRTGPHRRRKPPSKTEEMKLMGIWRPLKMRWGGRTDGHLMGANKQLTRVRTSLVCYSQNNNFPSTSFSLFLPSGSSQVPTQ